MKNFLRLLCTYALIGLCGLVFWTLVCIFYVLSFFEKKPQCQC